VGFRVSRPCGRRGQCSAPDVVGEGNAPLSGAMLPRCSIPEVDQRPSISEVYQRQRCTNAQAGGNWPGRHTIWWGPHECARLVVAQTHRRARGSTKTIHARTHAHARTRTHTHAPAAACARGCHKINPGRSQHLGLPGSARRHGTSVAAPSPSAPPALGRAPEGRALERLRGTASWRPCPAPCPALPW